MTIRFKHRQSKSTWSFMITIQEELRPLHPCIQKPIFDMNAVSCSFASWPERLRPTIFASHNNKTCRKKWIQADARATTSIKRAQLDVQVGWSESLGSVHSTYTTTPLVQFVAYWSSGSKRGSVSCWALSLKEGVAVSNTHFGMAAYALILVSTHLCTWMVKVNHHKLNAVLIYLARKLVLWYLPSKI